MSTSAPFHIVLVEPEIPQNSGNIGRLALGLGARLHLVHPLGFSLDEKAVRRAGLDYWKKVDVQEHPSLSSFMDWVGERPMFLFSTKAAISYKKACFPRGSLLIFGPES
ncbi:MAG: TrmH family RNA methyltransferase, partial [Myxococcota bacterium]|nr:TrmH family RNA methyltransferase [Myxococcota bacterium]